MDHQLIDRALAELSSTKAESRTQEQIQGFAVFICEAADVSTTAPTALQQQHTELVAAIALLAAELGDTKYDVSLKLGTSFSYKFTAWLYFRKNITAFGWGDTPEKVLQSLRADIGTKLAKEAA